MQLFGLVAIVSLVALNIWLWRMHRRWQEARKPPIDVVPPCEPECPTCAALEAAAEEYEPVSFSDKLR